jgi:radical SAM-linked protein
VSTHVPKPHTPFQWAAMDSEEETGRKQTLLADLARGLRVDLKMHENYQSHIECIFSRGDRAAGDLLERAYRLGCRFDGWDEGLQPHLWERALEEERAEHGFDEGRYLNTIPVTARLPWDHIDVCLEPDFLVKEYRKALKDRLSPPCGKPYKQLLHHTNVAAAEGGTKQKLVCYDCGVACDLEGMKQERLYFLRRMNAWTPPPPPAPMVRPAAGDKGGAESRGRRKRPVALVQGQFFRYRLRYTKHGRVAYLGHLDLIRHLPRIFRRAAIELHYSEGFHARPDLSFGPALGLGIPSLGEILDLKLAEVIEPAELVRRLSAVTLEGVDLLDAVALGEQDRALGRVLTSAEYAALLPEGAVEIALARFASAEPLSLVRAPAADKAGGIGRRVDVRRSLLGVGRGAARAAEVFGWPAAQTLVFSVAISAEGNARPAEILEALIGADLAGEADVARLALWSGGRDGQHEQRIDPLDLLELRRDHDQAMAAVAQARATAAAPAS